MVEKIRTEKIKQQYKNFLFLFLFIVFLIRFGFSSFASWDYGYTGGVQQFQAPTSAWYKLEVWGAQGGNQVNDNTKNITSGGKGGYAQGQVWLNQGQIIYIVVGGQGGSRTFYPDGHYGSSVEINGADGGYNGGGKGGQGTSDSNTKRYRIFSGGAGGGGATHIATTDRGTLNNYSSAQGEILIVAGGGGGASGGISGGTGGGENGGASSSANYTAGGSQSSGYKFGTGGNGQTIGNIKDGNYNNREGRGGGGGGWYGGYGGNGNGGDNSVVGGGGGSGHLNVSNGSMENGVQEGNGFARIDYAHTHNQDGRYYEQVDDTQHRVYKYCNEHDGSRDYNNDGGTLESHSWYATSSWYNGGSVEKQDQRCSTCGRTRTITRNHTYKDNWVYEGRQTNTSYARHNVYHYYTCTTCDSRYDATQARYSEDCYDANDDGKCDFCGRQRVCVNINVLTPEGNEDTSGQTATFNVEWYDNTTFCSQMEQQKHTAGPVADQPYDKVWVGTTITISNITMKKSYLDLSGVTGTTRNGSIYTYTVNSAGTINIKTAYKSYKLTINPNGGTLNVTDDSIKKNSDGTATATVTYNSQGYYYLGVTASREHYTMDGFYTSASMEETKLWYNGGPCIAGNGYWDSNNKWCYAGDVTVYAHWSDAPGYHNGVPIVYTITYTLYPRTGTGNIDIAFKPNVKLKTTYTIKTETFEVPSLEDTSGNYSFEGWYGSCSSGSKTVTIKKGTFGDLHFEADWLPTKDSSKGDGHDQNLPYVKTTEIKENTVKIAA